MAVAPIQTSPFIKPRTWTREEYERLIDLGVFHEGERLELIEGEILEMAPQKSRHAGTVLAVQEALRAAIHAGHVVRAQLPLIQGDLSEPEPDLSVVRGGPRDFFEAHPDTASLVVEVSDTTLLFDRGPKLALYARNGIPELWIVNLVDERLEVYRRPHGESYRDRFELGKGDRVESGVLREPVEVADLLP
jgi:Uma2 family endonuclease